MEVSDILLDENTQELLFDNGDFKIGLSDQQHIDHLMRANPGQYYQFPKIGIGIDKFKLASVNRQEIQQAIRLGLEADNYNVIDLSVTEATNNEFIITTNPERIK